MQSVTITIDATKPRSETAQQLQQFVNWWGGALSTTATTTAKTTKKTEAAAIEEDTETFTAPEDEDVEPTITLSQLRKALNTYATENDHAAAMGLLKKFKVKKLDELAKADYPKLLKLASA